MTVAAVATAVALGIILAIGHSRMSGIVTISLVVGGAISVFQPFVQRELAEAQSSYRRTSVAFISTTPAAVETATTIGLLLVRQMSVVWSALASLLAEIARIVVAFISWLRTGRRVSAASPSTAVDLSRQTIRLGIVTILPILVTNVDTVAFAAFVPTETLGSFAVTKVVVTLMILVASTLEGTVVRAAPRTVWRYFLLYAALGVAAGAAGYAFAPLLFGQAFEPSRFAFVSSAAASIFAATYSTLATRAVWRGNSALAIRASLVAFLTVTIAAIAIGYLVVRPSAWMLALPALLSYISAIAIILIWSRKEKGQE